MLSDTDPLLPSCSEPYQMGLKRVSEQDCSQNTGSSIGEKEECANEVAEKLAEPVQILRPTSKEFKKTWGFRRTTIAQRETLGDADGSLLVRRTGRQARCVCRVEESIPTAKRGRGVRKSAPACLENPEPSSQTPSVAETPSKAGSTVATAFASTTKAAAVETQPLEGKTSLSVCLSECSSSDQGRSSDQVDSDDLTLKELQDRLKRRRKKDLLGLSVTDSLTKEDEACSRDKPAMPDAIKGMAGRTSAGATGEDSRSTQEAPKSSKEKCNSNSDEDEELPGKANNKNKSHCPDTLYCICRQKHNNRFMICCDRCEEWFHGDCVGVTEACGRLLEKNGEDYTCPNCAWQRSQTAAAKSSEGDTQATSWVIESPLSQSLPSTATKENNAEDQGIKGKIERISNPSEKKKMKIFQPVVKTSTLPNCIGPSCGKSALPDSVYCGTECILKHAAAAMKSLTKVKEPTPKTQFQKKPATKSILKARKRPLSERTTRRSLESCSRAEENESSSEEEAVVGRNLTAPLWSSDHNCITGNQKKATAIPSSVFYKLSGKEREEMEGKKESSPLQLKSSLGLHKGNKNYLIPGDPPTNSSKLLSQPVSSDEDSKDCTLTSKCLTSRKCSPALTSQPSSLPTSGRHILGALRLKMATYNKLTRQPNLPPTSSSDAALVPLAPVFTSKPPQAQPNITIRHNIRCSLAEILFKRVSDSDDQDMSQRDVGKLAASIEKELYDLCLNTDNNYKNKYRSILLNLKDPKNMGLFTLVVNGEVSPFKLVRLSPEEMLSKEIARAVLREKTEILVHSPKAQPGQLKQGLKREHSPPAVMEESPPVSDGDACISAGSSSPCIAAAPEQQDQSLTSAMVNPRQPNVSPIRDVFSKMLKDTTAEHRTHLFNLNCKICTGQMPAEDEPVPKKVKNSVNKKVESKTKPLSLISKVGDHLGDESLVAPLDGATYLMESPASPDDTSCTVTLSEPVTIPAVPSVVIAGRDPRTAGYRPPISVTSTVPTVSRIFESSHDMPVHPPAPPPPPPPTPPIPKSILTKPTSSSHMRFLTTSGSSSSVMDSHSPPGGDTALFLSKQEVQWKGFINMYSVAKFVTKAYLVSGSFEYLKEDLPDTIQIGGRISPDTVWDYVAKIKTSVTKELCLIRFHPASEEEEVAYTSLFSYFNSRGRFGVVANNSHRIKDLYLIPLGAKAPIPSKLMPIEGPGLETNHPNLLLGLAICQKPKCSGGLQGEEDKCSKFQIGHPDATSLPSLPAPPTADINEDKERIYNPEIQIGTSPPGSPSSVSSSDSSSSSFSASLLLHQLKPIKAYAPITTNSGKESSSPTTAPTPLQTILKTLFGKSKINSPSSLSPLEQNLVKMEVSPTAVVDPIVQQFGQISEDNILEDENNRSNYPKIEFNLEIGSGVENGEGDRLCEPGKEFKAGIDCGLEKDEDDRPYDPEEEYKTGISYGVKDDGKDGPYGPEEKCNPVMGCKMERDEDDRPYDPEEEYNPEMSYGVEEDEDDRPYDPEEYNPEICYGVEEDEDDRPYDPEEEYPGMDYELEPVQKVQDNKSIKAFSDDEVAYDPEDETIFEEVKGNLTDSPHQMKGLISHTNCVSGSESLTLTEQRKMLEELNKQIEEHERQLAEQEEALRQQRAAVGVSLAHFSVSDALMSPPLKPLLTNSELLQLDTKEELTETPCAPVINQRRDPRQSKDPHQTHQTANQMGTSDRMVKDGDVGVSVDQKISLKQDSISQSPSESVDLDAGSSEVHISPVEEKIDPGIQGDVLQESQLEQKIKKTSEAQIERSPYANWQNSASIFKDEELSSCQSNSPKQFQASSGSKRIPYRSILRNKTSRRSFELSGNSPDILISNISMADAYESTKSSGRVYSPDLRGSEDMSHSISFRSSHKSPPVPESPILQRGRDQPQFRDTKFRSTVRRPPYQNPRGEKMHADNRCRHTPSEMFGPRGPYTSPMDQKEPRSSMTESSLLPNNIGQRGLSPDRFLELDYSPPPLDVPNDSHQLCPSFNFSGPRRLRIRQIDDRDPQLSNSHSSPGYPHKHQFMDHRSQKPPLSRPRFADDQCHSVSYQQHMDNNERQTPHAYRENPVSLQTPYLRPVYEMRGQRFRQPQDFAAPRAPSPHLHSQRVPLGQYRGSFENQNSPEQSKLKRQRGLSPPLFDGPQDNLDHFESQDHTFVERPLRRSGPLLPTPIEGPILPHHMRNTEEHHRTDWRHSPDMRSDVKGDSELHNNESRTRMFGGYHEEVEAQVPCGLSVESQQGLFEERRRGQDASHSRLWNRSKYWNREQEWDCSRGREVEKHRNDGDRRERDRDIERDRSRSRDWNRRDGERSRIRDRNKDQDCDRYLREERRVQSRSRDHGKHRDRDHGRDKDQEIEKRLGLERRE